MIQVAGIELHQYHLPLLSALSFNAECELLEEDLEAFWDGLTDGDTSVPIVSFVANWLSNHINEKTTLKTIVTSIEDIAKRSKTKKWVRFDEQKRLKRFLNSLKRFVVPGRKYFWHEAIFGKLDPIGKLSIFSLSIRALTTKILVKLLKIHKVREGCAKDSLPRSGNDVYDLNRYRGGWL